MNYQDMSIKELRSHMRDVQYEMFDAQDAGDAKAAEEKKAEMGQIDGVLQAKIEGRFWEAQQRDTSNGF